MDRARRDGRGVWLVCTLFPVGSSVSCKWGLWKLRFTLLFAPGRSVAGNEELYHHSSGMDPTVLSGGPATTIVKNTIERGFGIPRRVRRPSLQVGAIRERAVFPFRGPIYIDIFGTWP